MAVSVLKTATGGQAWIAATVSGSAGRTVEIADASGAVIASFEADDSFGAELHIGPDVAADGTYSMDRSMDRTLSR